MVSQNSSLIQFKPSIAGLPTATSIGVWHNYILVYTVTVMLEYGASYSGVRDAAQVFRQRRRTSAKGRQRIWKPIQPRVRRFMYIYLV